MDLGDPGPKSVSEAAESAYDAAQRAEDSRRATLETPGRAAVSCRMREFVSTSSMLRD